MGNLLRSTTTQKGDIPDSFTTHQPRMASEISGFSTLMSPAPYSTRSAAGYGAARTVPMPTTRISARNSLVRGSFRCSRIKAFNSSLVLITSPSILQPPEISGKISTVSSSFTKLSKLAPSRLMSTKVWNHDSIQPRLNNS